MHFLPSARTDWVDVVSALKADPQKTSEIAALDIAWPKSSPKYFAGVQQKLKAFVESGQLGIFADGYSGNPSYELPAGSEPAGGDALPGSARSGGAIRVKIHTIFGGRPHPNFLVGGGSCLDPRDKRRGLLWAA